MRSRVSSFSYAVSGASGSDGTSAGGSEVSSMCSPVLSGDVDSIVLMRTIVRLRRFSAELAAQGLAGGVELAALAAHAARPRVAAKRIDHGAAHPPLGEGLELD